MDVAYKNQLNTVVKMPINRIKTNTYENAHTTCHFIAVHPFQTFFLFTDRPQ